MEELIQENQTLSKLLEKREAETTSLKEVVDELMSENNSKDETIAKASKVIDMLRQQVEKSFGDLQNSESTRTKLVKENRELEKELLELKKTSQQLNAIKKAETRAKNEKRKLKEELNQTALDFGNKENELLKRFNEIQEENKRLLAKCEGLHEKFKDLQEKMSIKEKNLQELDGSFRALQEKYEESRLNLDKMQEERAMILKSHQSEVSLIKREAENKIRVLQNLANKEKDVTLKSTARPLRNYLPSNPENSFVELNSQESVQKNKKKRTLSSLNQKKINEDTEEFREENNQNYNNFNGNYSASKPLLEFLKESLSESLERERKLMEKMDGFLRKEAKKMGEKASELERKEIALRPEVERWMMKYQEIRQRYEDCLLKMSNMTILLKDYEKAIGLIKRLNNEEKRNSDNLAKELESNINFFQVEIQEKNKVLIDNNAYNLEAFQQLMESSQSRIHDLSQNLAYLKHTNQLIKQDRDYLYQTFTEYKKMVSANAANLLDLQKLLSLTSQANPSENTDSLEVEPFEMIDFETIFKKLEELIEKASVLEQENDGLLHEKRKYEAERANFSEQLTFLQDSLAKMNARLEQCNETIQNLEKQNQILRETSKSSHLSNESAQILSELQANLQKKSEKCRTLKKNLEEKDAIIKSFAQKTREFDSLASKDSKTRENPRRSFANSMSFEENPNKNLLNTHEEDDFLEEFASEFKDQAEFARKFEVLKQKTKQNKQRFQRKLREFEHILRFIEKSLDILIDNNAVNEEKDAVLVEILEKNENLRDWMLKLRGSLQMLATKTQRSLAGERDFAIKVAVFLADVLDSADFELKSATDAIKNVNLQSLKQLAVQNLKTKISVSLEEFAKKEFRTPKKNAKNNEALVFLKEIYGDLKEIIGKCGGFTSKLDEKFKKMPVFSEIIAEDSYTIFNGLEQNLKETKGDYLASLKFLWENYFLSLKDNASLWKNPEFGENQLRHMFFSMMNTVNMQKLQEELQNLKNAMNLLDISHFNSVLKADEKSADLLRKKAVQNNEILENLVEKSNVLLESLEFPYKELDWNSFLKASPADFEESFMQFMQTHEKKHEFLLKTSIFKQIHEILRENVGFKIAYNDLVYIMLKYKHIIGEIMKNRANFPAHE